MYFFDAHCHLADDRLAGQREAILQAARQAGVMRLMVNGTGVEDWPVVAKLAAKEPGVQASFGVHPWKLGTQPPTWRETLLHYLDTVPSAIGETGLDGLRQDVSLATQEEAFLFHWRLSVDRRLPVTVHCVKALGRLLELIQQEGEHPVGFLLHGYGGSEEMVPRFAELGGHFSFGGAVTYGRERLSKAAVAVPDDRLLLESDAPDQPPASRRGQLNEPACLLEAAAVLAKLLDCSPAGLAAQTFANADRLFN